MAVPPRPPRVATQVATNALGTVTRVPAQRQGIRAERFTSADVANPITLAASLTRLSRTVDDVTVAARSNPILTPIYFDRLTAGTAGAKTKVTHNLGRYARWLVVGWRSVSTASATTSLWSLVEDTNDTSPATSTTVLALKSYTAGVFDLMVF